MDKQNLLTIGSLSKQTGVHIKSLRYYEQLGILRPAHTDPDTGYRYYTLSQIPVVDAIRACIFLDIPLKEFTTFLTKDQQRIHYKKLISHGTMLAHQKIRDIQEKLHLLEKFQKQMDRMEGFQHSEEQTVHVLPEKYCWAVPYAGKQHNPDYNILITRMFNDISRNELRLGAEAGLLSFHRSAGTEQFLYVEVEATKKDARQLKEIMRLPAAAFLCAITQESGIGKAPLVFPELFARGYDKIIMETELFSGDYDVAHPKFELRCSLPPEEK
ncbi:MerR family transcriptional regulator [Akkermansia sp.]|uniref:MerR family DNA-binding transcriptional regulator n=1 Tax=Akkermansia sp. TaxID=1872421 RepID=UPI0025C000B2|nr:MerR family transcriptional regulator [Akkermansia sp.]